MQDKIGTIYQIVASIIGIIGGILMIVYRKNLLQAQKKYFAKHKDFLNQKMSESLENRSEKNSYILIIIVSVLLIIGGIIQLKDFL